jgi:hypothetical protein
VYNIVKKLMLFSALIGIVQFFSACSQPRYLIAPDDNMYILADYEDALKAWSAHDEIHRNMIGLAEIDAVYRSWEVRQSYLNSLRTANISRASLIRTEEREKNQFRKGHEFTLGLYCHDSEWNRLTGMDPIWHLTLHSDTGRPVKPVLIESLDVSPEEAYYFFRDIGHGGKLYRVVFPLMDDLEKPLIDKSTRLVVLSVDSLLGNMELKWKLKCCPAADPRE